MFLELLWVIPRSWKQKRILSEGIDFKQLQKSDFWKVAKYSSSKDLWCQLAREYYNLSYKPILSKVQRFQYLCQKLKQKSVIHQLTTKGRVLLILSELIILMFITIPPPLYSSHKIFQFVLWHQKWVNGKTKITGKVLNCFRVRKFELV